MNDRALIAAATLMGIGMGGFVDGILFHQVLQLHSMLSAKLPQDSVINIKISMFWDGLFHAFTWITTAFSIWLLWHAGRHATVPWPGQRFFGSLLMGWGAFNLVEGLIDHHLLGIHHVVERLGLSAYDYIFLLCGIVFIFTGMLLIRSSSKRLTSVR